MMTQLLTNPGFIYELNGTYYFLGKWICKECTETDACDCVSMYHICRESGDEKETGLYFQKIRAYSDFALDIPHNPALIRTNMEALLSSLSETAREQLRSQLAMFEEDQKRYA